MKKPRTRILAAIAGVALLVGGLTACTTDADTASRNIATAAEQFEVQRTIVGINGITGETTFFAEGRCSFESEGRRFDVTCRYGPDEYRKHVFIMGDQDSVSITQEQPIDVSVYHTRVILKPQSVLPEFDLEVGKQ